MDRGAWRATVYRVTESDTIAKLSNNDEKPGKWKSLKSCLPLCNPVDYTVHGILQARILEWVAFPFSRGSSQGSESGSPTLQADSLPAEPQRKPKETWETSNHFSLLPCFSSEKHKSQITKAVFLLSIFSFLSLLSASHLLLIWEDKLFGVSDFLFHFPLLIPEACLDHSEIQSSEWSGCLICCPEDPQE